MSDRVTECISGRHLKPLFCLLAATRVHRRVILKQPKNIGAFMNRASSYDEDLSAKLQDPKFAQSFLMGLMEGEEGLSIEDALRHTIKRMGVKEFSEATGVAHS